MSKYMNWKWKSFMALVAAINIVSLSGCNFAQATSADASSSSVSSSKTESSSTIQSSETTAASLEQLKATATGKASIPSTATYELAGGSSTKEDEDIAASDENKSGIKVSTGGKLTADTVKAVTKGNTSSLEESKFYGLNSGVLCEASSDISMKDSEVSTSGDGANAIFATGTNADITLSKVKASTSGNSARGLNTTYNGNIIATECTVSTTGENSPAIGNGIAGGSINFVAGTLTTSGASSPAIYSTGTINVTGATLASKKSEAVVVDGNSSATLTDVKVTSGGENGVLLYQNNTVESNAGTSTFNMVAGTLTSSKGALFSVTNTTAVINLNSVQVTNTSDTLLSSKSGTFGISESNGGNATFTADTMTLSGKIVCDMYSTVNFILRNSTSYTGIINGECSGKEVNVTLDAGSTWNVSGDSYITAFNDGLTLLTNIKDNGNTIYYAKDNAANSWLEGKTITLSGGGKLTPDLSKGTGDDNSSKLT